MLEDDMLPEYDFSGGKRGDLYERPYSYVIYQSPPDGVYRGERYSDALYYTGHGGGLVAIVSSDGNITEKEGKPSCSSEKTSISLEIVVGGSGVTLTDDQVNAHLDGGPEVDQEDWCFVIRDAETHEPLDWHPLYSLEMAVNDATLLANQTKITPSEAKLRAMAKNAEDMKKIEEFLEKHNLAPKTEEDDN